MDQQVVTATHQEHPDRLGELPQPPHDALDNGFVLGADPHRHEGLETATEGAEIDVGASGAVALTDRLDLSGRAGLTYATDDYMDTHFGIVPAQAAASGLPVFDPGAGFKDAYIRADLGYDLTDRFRLRAGLGYSRLIGDAADSPVVANRNQFDGQLGLSYTFRF